MQASKHRDEWLCSAGLGGTQTRRARCPGIYLGGVPCPAKIHVVCRSPKSEFAALRRLGSLWEERRRLEKLQELMRLHADVSRTMSPTRQI